MTDGRWRRGPQGCIVSGRIGREGRPVRFMYRQEPDNEIDSGWRFLAGEEDDDYVDDASNHQIWSLDSLAEKHPSIEPYLDAPPGSVFEREDADEDFEPVDDWEPPQEDD